MTGVLVNTATIIIGSLIGLIFNKGIPKKYTDAIMTGIGLCVIYIGISGTLEGENPLVLILSIVIGLAVGTWIDVDKRLNGFGEWVGEKFRQKGGDSSTVAEGLVTGSLLFCVGAMAIVGSLKAGFDGDNETLFIKSMLDFVSATVLATSLGIGVMLSAGVVLLYQGCIVMLAQFLQPFLTETAIAEITCAGSLVIMAIGLNLIGMTKIKVANYLPALILAPLISWLFQLLYAALGIS